MTQATITVAGIHPPGIGKKQGHIIDTTGGKWNVWGDKLHNYREGVTYDITYEVNEFNGAQFSVIKSVRPSNAAPGPQPQRQNDGWPGPQPRQASAPSAQVAFSPKDEMIFVCGIINNSLSNTNINPFEITPIELIDMINKARQAWRNTLGKAQSNNSDMNDEIPL